MIATAPPSTNGRPVPQAVPTTPKKPPAPRWDQTRVFTAVAVTAPAVRLVVVAAWADRGDVDHEIHPVVGISSVIVTEYARPHTSGLPHRSSAVAENLEADGWTRQWSGPNHDAIVIDPESGELAEARYVFDCSNVAYRVVAAPWHPSLDDERLAEPIEATRRKAIRRAIESGCWASIAAAVADGVPTR